VITVRRSQSSLGPLSTITWEASIKLQPLEQFLILIGSACLCCRWFNCCILLAESSKKLLLDSLVLSPDTESSNKTNESFWMDRDVGESKEAVKDLRGNLDPELLCRFILQLDHVAHQEDQECSPDNDRQAAEKDEKVEGRLDNQPAAVLEVLAPGCVANPGFEGDMF
jgi:hypothetical protein